MKNLIIRPIVYTDIASVYNVNKICLPVSYSIIEYVIFLNSSNKIIFVSEYQNVIVGYILCEIKNDTRLIHVMSFAVLPKCRQHGIGTKLMNKVIEYAKSINYQSVSLFVHVENIKGISFYKKNGFLIVETLLNFYNGSIPFEKSCDANYMVKNI